MTSREVLAPGWRERDDTRESFSSGEGKRGVSSGGLGWRMCAREEALTGGDRDTETSSHESSLI
jgi:hypothetical protein